MKASFFKTSFKVVGVASSTPRCMPKLEPVTLPSITKTFFPFCANAAPKLETKVVLPVPPLPEITEIMAVIKYTLLQRHYIDSQKDNANKYKHSKSLYCKGVKMGSVKDLQTLEKPTETQSGEGIFEFSDRWSAFDWGTMPDGIPGKGPALAMMAAHTFEQLEKEALTRITLA